MSVARNLWRVADAPHIVPADSVERQTAERLINACPAGLFSLTPEGNLRIDYRSCLECGTLIIVIVWSAAPAVCCAMKKRYNSGTIRLPDSASPTALDK